MARVFITGSAGGLGLMAGELLASQGHSVVLHARNEVRARDARTALPQAAAVVVGDLSTIAAMRTVADQANSLGRFDAVIHNVGIGYREPRRVTTEDGRSQLWAVNVLAPYVLTALMERAARTRWIATAARTACTTLLKSAMTLCRGPKNASREIGDDATIRAQGSYGCFLVSRHESAVSDDVGSK
jgi:NAD(P)-dependent dehydrogenase (short-subunit alcohol dehydrogenase family)